jgi:hypothetical protein
MDNAWIADRLEAFASRLGLARGIVSLSLPCR